MENITRTTWLKKPRYLWLALILLAAIAYGGNKIHKEVTMPPPLVFLIPDTYFGPVFFFFGQPDGVDLQRDPLGNAVRVPENGVVKIKASVHDAMGQSSEHYRATYMISVAKDGTRKVMIMNGDTYRDDNGELMNFYVDENSRLHDKFPSSEAKGAFYYFTEAQKNERMVFNHHGCPNQFSEYNAPPEKVTACGKFLVVSPNQFLTLPKFMWDDLEHAYESIQQFVDEANARVLQKRAYYKLPKQ